MKAEIQPGRHTALQVKCPWFLTNHNQTSPFIAHARRVKGMNFQENPSNGRNACTGTQNTAKGHCSASNANLIIYPSQGNFYSFWCVRDEYKVWIFRKIPQMEPWYSQEGTLPFKQGTLIVD